MKIFIATLMLVFSSMTMALPMTLGDITGNSAHTETDTTDELFQLTDTSGVLDDATAFLMFEMAGNADYNSFGIYDAYGSLEIFGGSVDPLSAATLSWDVGTDQVGILGTAASAVIDSTAFGFYIDTKNDGRFFSESALNGGEDYMYSFNVGASGYPDMFGANFVLAFEDLAAYQTDYDYNDMVVGISDISSAIRTTGNPPPPTIPEPMTMAMMGLGLAGMIGMRRNRKDLVAMRK